FSRCSTGCCRRWTPSSAEENCSWRGRATLRSVDADPIEGPDEGGNDARTHGDRPAAGRWDRCPSGQAPTDVPRDGADALDAGGGLRRAGPALDASDLERRGGAPVRLPAAHARSA